MYLFGASGHGKVINDIIDANDGIVQTFVDDDPNVIECCGKSVLHDATGLSPMIVSIGINSSRKIVVEKLISKNKDIVFASAIHPSAVVAPSVRIGEGTVVMAGVVINAETIVGKHCIVNTGASIDHECQIGDYVHISPHATLCGNVHVDEGSWIGAGTIVIPGVKIGKWCTIGAGSVVIRDIPDNVTAFGNPCEIKCNDTNNGTCIK